MESREHNSPRRWGMSRGVALWSTGVTCVCLAIAAAVSIGQIQEAPSVRDAETYTARDLATSFRTIAKETFPGIVAIETRGVATVQTQGGLDLEELFKGDPRFERFFKNMPEQRAPRRRVVPQGQGSGFIIDPKGFILTNNHVVEGAETITVRLHDGREYQAELIGTDSRSDVAVIKVEAPDLEPIPLGDSEEVEVGDIVLAFGSPFGLELTMTQGIISAKGRGPGINEREDYLQTDAAINPGNSGGPLINLRGQVIGINTAISSRSGGYDGVGFSIPINMAKWIADQLMESGEVKRAYIGVVIQPVTNDLANQLGLNVNEGAIVSQIMKDSPADKSGLETGDVILELDGRPVGGTRQLQGIVEQLSVGKSYPLSIYRNGKNKELTITMAEMPQDLALRGGQPSTSSREEETESVSVEDLGVEVQELTKDLAEQFGYSDDVSGVVISSVEPNSVAELNGLRAGEVIEKVGPQRVRSVDDFTAAIEEADLKDGVLMLVRRGPSSRFVVVKDK